MKRERKTIIAVLGPALKRASLALAIIGMGAALSGCLSVHVHKEKETEHPVVVPAETPPPPPAPPP